MRYLKIIDRGILRWFFIDYLSKPLPRKFIAKSLYFFSRLLALFARNRRAAELVMTSQRLFPSSIYTCIIKDDLSALQQYYSGLMSDDVKPSVAASRSIVVKMPRIVDGEVSKGIIFVTFTDTFRYYYYHIDINNLLKYFYVILEPSWAGYCLPEILFWTMFERPVVVQATEVMDREFIDSLDSNLLQIDTGASDWVNYNKYYYKQSEVIYDSIYVANYNPVKRLHVYFKALRVIKQRGLPYKGAIVCARWGGQREKALKLVDFYDVADVLDIHESLKAVEINSVLNRSKCNLLLSLKEGSNRSMFEAMFAGTPVIMLKSNVGVNKEYINASTGLLVDENDLVESLLAMREEYKDFSSRDWAMKNISPEVTTDKILQLLKSVDASLITDANDVKIKTNDPEVNYFDKSSSLDKVYFMNKVLSLFDVDNRQDFRENILFELSNEFYTVTES